LVKPGKTGPKLRPHAGDAFDSSSRCIDERLRLPGKGRRKGSLAGLSIKERDGLSVPFGRCKELSVRGFRVLCG
jgi:hypothetical protein